MASIVSTWLPLAVASAALSMGCGARTLESQTAPPPPTGPSASTPPPEAEQGGIWAECYSLFRPAGDAKQDLGRLTRSCGATGGMQAVTPVHVAQQSEKDPADRYTFYVPNSGACFRVYATGDRNVADLDLLIRNPDGSEVVADVTHDSYPVLPPRSPVCFDVPGLYMLEVSVFRGSGSYAVQVWGSAHGVGKTAASPAKP